MMLARVVERAKRTGRIKGGVVLCDNCDTPASKSLARKMSWVGCAPCILGESDSFDPKDLIHVQEAAK
jgi:hypothetical protein